MRMRMICRPNRVVAPHTSEDLREEEKMMVLRKEKGGVNGCGARPQATRSRRTSSWATPWTSVDREWAGQVALQRPRRSAHRPPTLTKQASRAAPLRRRLGVCRRRAGRRHSAPCARCRWRFEPNAGPARLATTRRPRPSTLPDASLTRLASMDEPLPRV
jgi:hypothetical protein